METYCLIGMEFQFFKMKRILEMDGGGHNNVKVLGASELYTGKWLRW